MDKGKVFSKEIIKYLSEKNILTKENDSFILSNDFYKYCENDYDILQCLLFVIENEYNDRDVNIFVDNYISYMNKYPKSNLSKDHMKYTLFRSTMWILEANDIYKELPDVINSIKERNGLI